MTTSNTRIGKGWHMHGMSGLVLLGLVAAAAAGPGAGWRTDGTGSYPESTPPLAWSSEDNVVWATPMPDWSNSTPVLCDDRLFVCAEPTTLLAVRLADGAILWQADNGFAALDPPVEAELPKTHNVNGYSSCTPVTDGRHVYAIFTVGTAAGYDLDGQRRWIRRIDPPVSDWGHSSSPVLVGDTLIVLVKDLVGLDAATGAERWRTPSAQRWGTPIHARIGDVDCVVTPGGQIVSVADGAVLCDGLPSLEFNAPLLQDGVLYFIQGQSHAYRMPATVKALPPEHLWQTGIPKNRYYASPVLCDGLIYAIHRGRMLTVLDAANGEKVYSMKLDVGRGNAFPSIAVAGGHVFVSNDSGITLVLKPGRTHQEIARNQVGAFRSTPVFAGRRLYVRGLERLICIEAPAAESSRSDGEAEPVSG